MSRLTTDMQIKMESNDLQTYLDTFNKEIEEGNRSLSASLVDAADLMSSNSKDGDEDGGTYFIDQAGNYYYQATKDSDPIPTDPPENVQIVDDESEGEEIEFSKTIVKNRKSYSKNKKSRGDDDSINYVYALDDNEGEVDEEGNEIEEEHDINDQENEEDNEMEDSDDDKVFEFDENEETSSKKSDFVEPKVVMLKPKNGTGITHQCPHCEYVSSKRYLLARHLKCHSDERPYKCPVCERGFKTNASLQNHANTHTGNKPHRCKFCVSTFTTSGELVRHVRYKHTHEKPHKCFECDYASVELSKLKRHIRCHTGERPYQCPHCTYASPDTFKLKRHLRTHTGEKPYECDICHSKFTQSNSLKQHKLIHSVGDKPVFQCHLCPTTCGRKTDLRIHIQKLHTSERPLTCRRCHKSFPDRYTYKVHSKTHDGEKCFKCDLCPYASISQRHLDSHLLIHTDQKPFKCNFCDLSFRQKQLLRRHVNLYHDKTYVPPQPQEKSHSCPDCKRAFSRKGNLMRHMATHDPESTVKEEKEQLKLGRLNRIEGGGVDDDTLEVLSEIGEDMEEEEEYEVGEEEEEEVEEIENYISSSNCELNSSMGNIIIKKEDEKDLVALEDIDGQQYMVVEIVQSDDENDLTLEEEKLHSIKHEQFDDEFIISELVKEGGMGETSKSASGMDDCFGFSESEEILDPSIISQVDESSTDCKTEIQLLEILQ